MQQISTSRQRAFDLQRLGTPTWVLDTNVVLDLFVFQDPSCARLAAALAAAPGGWAATRAMRAEFDGVMGRVELARWGGERLDFACAQWARLSALIDPEPASQRDLICTDPTDQKFLDLAVSLRPCWLLSRDAAVLRLERRAAALGIRIVTATAWDAEMKRGDPLDRPVP